MNLARAIDIFVTSITGFILTGTPDTPTSTGWTHITGFVQGLRQRWQARQKRAQAKEEARSPSERRRRKWIAKTAFYSLMLFAFFLTGGPKGWRLNYDLVMTGIAIGAVMDVELDEAARRKVIHGALQALDRNSRVLSTTHEEVERRDKEGTKEGNLGFSVAKSPRITVTSVKLGGPADRAGLEVGDTIIALGDLTLTNKIIRPQSVITYYIRTLNEVDEIDVTVERDGALVNLLVAIEKSRIDWAHRVGNFDGILQILVTKFSPGMTAQVRQIIDAERVKAPIRGVLFDMRGNPGGWSSETAELASLFLPERTVIAHRTGRAIHFPLDSETTTSEPEAYPDIKQVGVIINRNSASAAEQFSAMVKDYEMGPVVGEVSYGKGSSQKQFTYPGGPVFRLTTARFTGPKGTLIDGVGVKPDVLPTSEDGKVENWDEVIEKARQDMLAKTLP